MPQTICIGLCSNLSQIEHLQCPLLWTVILFQLQTLNEKIEKEKKELLGGGTNKLESGGTSGGGKDKNWSAEEIQHLIKAVNLFPAGTNNR